MAWNTSNRKSRLPRDWNRTRTRILARDKRTCQLRFQGCTVKATQVDHIKHGDDHSDSNLQAVCAKCHSVKSAREGRQVQLRRRALGKRPPETHPGLINADSEYPYGRPVRDNDS